MLSADRIFEPPAHKRLGAMDRRNSRQGRKPLAQKATAWAAQATLWRDG